jgi:hypothetical protein
VLPVRRTGERLLVACAYACVTALLAYAVLRGVEHAFFPEPNPAMLLWSDRSRYAWRVAISLYAGGMGGLGGDALSARAPLSGAVWLFRATLAAAVLLVAQAMLVP